MKKRFYIERTAAVVCAIVALLPAVQTFGQSAPPPPPVQTPPTAKTLRVTTRAVQVSVIAHNKDGRPITGLTKNDFTIFDNGVPQKIASFAQQSSRVTADVRSAPTSVPEHVFSNRLEQKSSVPPSVTVILLDTINTDFH